MDVVFKQEEELSNDNKNNLDKFIDDYINDIIECNSTEMRRQNSFCVDDVKQLMKFMYYKAKEDKI